MIYEISNNTLDAKRYLIEADSHFEALEKYSKEKARRIISNNPNLERFSTLDGEQVLIKPLGDLIK